MENARGGMLCPYRVLDLSDERGFLCGKILADLGADVIKIERPGGDAARERGPFFRNDHDPNKSLYWWAFNTSKRGLTLNLESEDGRSILRRLISSADILVESFDPGYLVSLGLGYDALKEINPNLILTSISGFGQTGPYSHYKAADLVVWALSGNAYLTGDPDRGPLAPGVPMSYLFASMQAAIGTLVALYYRPALGQGQHVDASAQLSLIWPVGPEAHGLWEQDGTITRRQGRWWSRPQTGLDQKTSWINIPLLYRCLDGDITFAAMSGAGLGNSANSLVKWMAEENMAGEALKNINWSNFDWQTARQELADEIGAEFARFFATRSKAELFQEAEKRGIMLYPVLSPSDLLRFEQLDFRRYWQLVDHGELGKVAYPGPFFKSSEDNQTPLRRAPGIGEHNVQILSAELGFSAQDLEGWQQAGVI